MIKFSKILNREKYMEELQNLLRYCMKQYLVNPDTYFYSFKEEEFLKDMYGDKLVYFCDSDLNVDLEMIEYAAEIFGLDREDILSINKDAINKWNKKYPFFDLLHEAEFQWELCNEGDEPVAETAVEAFLEGMSSFKIRRKPRFDRVSIEDRFYKKFQEMKYLIPEMRNWNQIKIEYIKTSVICDYEEAKEMVSSFLDMVGDLKILFNRALNEDLTNEEIKQYNFLSTVFHVQDKQTSHSFVLHYQDLKKCAEIYKKEGKTSFEQIAKISQKMNFSPYRFSGFTLDKDLAQAYVDIFPNSKRQMREYANLVEFFEIGFENVSDNRNTVFENHQKIFVRKSPEELRDEEYYARKLASFGKSKNLGGLIVNKDSSFSLPDINEVSERLGKIRHCNYFEQHGIHIDWENEDE